MNVISKRLATWIWFQFITLSQSMCLLTSCKVNIVLLTSDDLYPGTTNIRWNYRLNNHVEWIHTDVKILIMVLIIIRIISFIYHDLLVYRDLLIIWCKCIFLSECDEYYLTTVLWLLWFKGLFFGHISESLICIFQITDYYSSIFKPKRLVCMIIY